MNYIYIIILIFLFLKKGNSSGILDLIKNIDIEAIAPYLEMFGIDKNINENLKNLNLEELLNGKIDLATILPKLMPLLSGFFKSKSPFSAFNENSATFENEYLSPIKDIAGDNIINTFEDIFSN